LEWGIGTGSEETSDGATRWLKKY